MKGAAMTRSSHCRDKRVCLEAIEDKAVAKRDLQEFERSIDLKINQSKVDIIKWMFGLQMGSIGLILAAFKLMS